MLSPVFFLFLLSPIDVVEMAIDRGVFPPEARGWHRLGMFVLRDSDEKALLFLYQYDSDLEFRSGRKEALVIPNTVKIHAVYRRGSGKWFHQELFAQGRVSLVGLRVKAASLDLEFQVNVPPLIEWNPGEDVAKAFARGSQDRPRSTVTIRTDKGQPFVAK